MQLLQLEGKKKEREKERAGYSISYTYMIEGLKSTRVGGACGWEGTAWMENDT